MGWLRKFKVDTWKKSRLYQSSTEILDGGVAPRFICWVTFHVPSEDGYEQRLLAGKPLNPTGLSEISSHYILLSITTAPLPATCDLDTGQFYN